MKKLFIIGFFFLINTSFSQPIFNKWTAIRDFHEVLSQTFHASEEANLEPIKLRSEELMNKGYGLLKLDIPEEYRTTIILSLIEKLQIECKTLNLLVIRKATDQEITKSITKVDNIFHNILEHCNDYETK